MSVCEDVRQRADGIAKAAETSARALDSSLPTGPKSKRCGIPDSRYAADTRCDWVARYADSHRGWLAGAALPSAVWVLRETSVSEGLSWMMSRTAAALVGAAAAGSALLLDYIFRASGARVLDAAFAPAAINWSVHGAGALLARCRQQRACKVLHVGTDDPPWRDDMMLRHAYGAELCSRVGGQRCVGRPGVAEGFPWRAACAFAGLFSPSARVVRRHGPLLEALRDPRTLSIGIYFRTGEAESSDRRFGPHSGADEQRRALDRREQRRLPPSVWRADARAAYFATAGCALALEARWAAGFERVIWLVLGDSPNLNGRFAADFDRGDAARRVVRTNATGEHTVDLPGRGRRRGAARERAVFAQAAADWWLLGEVDVAVLGSDGGGSAWGGATDGVAWVTGKRVHPFAATALSRTLRTRSVFLSRSWEELVLDSRADACAEGRHLPIGRRAPSSEARATRAHAAAPRARRRVLHGGRGLAEEAPRPPVWLASREARTCLD
jgi:hypothetical protein